MLLAVCGGEDLMAYETFREDGKSFNDVVAFAEKFSDRNRCRGVSVIFTPLPIHHIRTQYCIHTFT